MTLHSYFVPDWMDDGKVSLKCRDDNSVGGRDHHRPDWGSCDPDATDELIIDTVTWQQSLWQLCCCQGLETQGRGQGRGLENWSSRILQDKDFPRGQHCNTGSQINARVF